MSPIPERAPPPGDKEMQVESLPFALNVSTPAKCHRNPSWAAHHSERPPLKRRVSTGKEYELYSGGRPPGEKVDSRPKANSQFSDWPRDF